MSIWLILAVLSGTAFALVALQALWVLSRDGWREADWRDGIKTMTIFAGFLAAVWGAGALVRSL